MKQVKIPRVFFCPDAILKTCLLVFFGMTMLNTLACEKKKTEAPTPPAVEAVQVIQKDVPIYLEWVGTADGFVNATIRAQVQGYLIKQNYREGDFIRKGQTLFEIDHDHQRHRRSGGGDGRRSRRAGPLIARKGGRGDVRAPRISD